MINGVWRHSVLDVKVKRSADVGSDHHLVTAHIKVKLKKTEAITNTQAKFVPQRLRDKHVKATFISEKKQIPNLARLIRQRRGDKCKQHINTHR
jgi:hypothetical protein